MIFGYIRIHQDFAHGWYTLGGHKDPESLDLVFPGDF